MPEQDHDDRERQLPRPDHLRPQRGYPLCKCPQPCRLRGHPSLVNSIPLIYLCHSSMHICICSRRIGLAKILTCDDQLEGMELNSQVIPGQMVRSTSPSAPSNQAQTSLTRSYFLERWGRFGGMLTATGPEPASTAQSSSYPLRRGRQAIHFRSPMAKKSSYYVCNEPLLSA